MLKAKYCPQVVAVASEGSDKVVPSSEWHFVNAAQLVQAVSCTQETQKTQVTLTLIFNRVLEVVEVYVRAKFHQAKSSGSWVIVFTEKIGTDAIVASKNNQK